ncbi:transcriptional regulator [candidate division WOR-3 bacterium]|nr:transcriptional regulator [candidate division WOR-3 bacterium]
MDKLKEISIVLSEMSDPEIACSFLRALLTKDEIKMISSRWELSKMLACGLSQRKISKKLGLSLCKITRGSKELGKRNSALKRGLNVLKPAVISALWIWWAV